MAETRKVPANAFTLAAGEVHFGDNGENAKTAPIRMVARSRFAIDHPWWGRIVHDLSGFTVHKPRLLIDYNHEEPIGFLNKFGLNGDGDLEVSGALVPTSDPRDPTPMLIERQRGGVPYEASINFGGDGIEIQDVPEGHSTEVNGYVFDGPGVVVRKWPLRGVAVTPYGADSHTSSSFADAAEEISISVQPQQEPVKMAADQTTTTEEAAQAVDPVSSDTPEVTPAATVEGEAQPAENLSDPRAECRQFLAAFGAQGAAWFAEGRTFAEAQSLYTKALEERLTAAEAKLSAASFGEAKPVRFSSSPSEPQQGRIGLAGKIRLGSK